MKGENMVAVAIAVAANAFKGVVDKSGKPYILHCLRVMNSVDQKDEELMCIAVLHDIVEDKKVTVDQLIEYGFTKKVIDHVEILTHDKKKDTYEEYIKKISHHPLAVAVKLADLKDNSDITRLKGLRKKDIERIEKYHRAFVYLSD